MRLVNSPAIASSDRISKYESMDRQAVLFNRDKLPSVLTILKVLFFAVGIEISIPFLHKPSLDYC